MRLEKSFRRVAVVLTCLVLASPLLAAQKGGSFWNLDVVKAWKVTQSDTRPMLLFVTMDGCTYCDKMKYETYSDAGVKATIQKSFVAASANAADNPALIRRFKIESFPQTIIFAPNGQVLDSIAGYIGPEQMQSRLQAATPRRVITPKTVSTSKK